MLKSRKQKYFALAVAIVVVAGGGVMTRALFLGGSGAQSSGNIDLQRGLVGWWKLDGNAKDSTPYANNGTVTGATPTIDREGKASGAYSFDGTSNYISLPNKNIPQDGTVSGWFKTSFSSRMMIMAAEGTYTFRFGVNYKTGTSGTSSGYLGVNVNYGTLDGYVDVGPSLYNGNWHNYIFAWKGSSGEIDIWLDGVQQTVTYSHQGTWNGGTNSSNFDIGADNQAGSTADYFNGSIDDVRIYNRALSASEVSALYNSYDSSLNLDYGQSGLVGWWKLDGNAKDSTPYANNGIVTGATLTTDREGAANSAYNFNGSNQYITVANNSVFKPSSSLSVGLWLKPSNVSSTATQSIVSATESGSYQLSINGSGANAACNANTVCFLVDIAGAYRAAQVSKSSLSNGTWYHLMGTYNGSVLALYINDSLANSVSISGNITEVSTPLCIGDEASSSSCSGGQYFGGAINDVRIYNRALSASEISNLYNSYDSNVSLYSSAGSSGQSVNLSQGLIGYWPFSGNAKDDTPYGDSGVVSGATLTTDRLGRANNAYSFNGSSSYIRVASLVNVPASTMTICAWINTSSSGYEDIAQLGRNSSDASTEFVWYINGGKLGFWDYGSAYGYNNVYSTGSVNSGTWHLGCFVKNSTSGTFYIDGVASGTATAAVDATYSSNDFVIGEDYRSGSNSFNGSIDDIRLYNRALSATEIAALYNLED